MLGWITETNHAERFVRELFDSAGVGVEGKQPGDILVKNPEFYGRLVRDASIGLGESYMEEWWECDRLDLFIEKLLRIDIKKKITGSLKMKLLTLQALITNMQSLARAKQVAEAHYDIGNDLYEVMLCKRMVYTCGYWKNQTTLDGAQEAKLELICKKAGLEKGMQVLDMGCGFGGFAMYAAEKYGCDVVGVTISKEQQRWGAARAKQLGLTGVDLRVQDYRTVHGHFDRVISIGMLEHVGWKNHRKFMEVAHRNLKKEGIAVLHTIGSNDSQKHGIPFFEKYIFPNAASPSIAQLGKAMEDLFVLEDVHNIGPDYRPTLLAWWDNFEKGYKNLDQKKYDRKFWLMWRFYLLAAAGAVAARESQLYHLVLTHVGRDQPNCRFS
ncbi:MAG: cyclopropane fatty acyl phospholipid synthase [Polyangiaceae bacterium]|nr:cyclopropane fatty acyl phospholipid synthase [Polyangiaceae bacterium]